MKNRVQFTKTGLVPRPEPGKTNLFVDRQGSLRSVDDSGIPKYVGSDLSNVIPTAEDTAQPHVRINDGTLYVYDALAEEWRTVATTALA